MEIFETLIGQLPRCGEFTASAHHLSRGSTNMDSMEISMHSDKTIQHSVTSPSEVSERSSVEQQVMESLYTDENHAVIISRAKAGGN